MPLYVVCWILKMFMFLFTVISNFFYYHSFVTTKTADKWFLRVVKCLIYKISVSFKTFMLVNNFRIVFDYPVVLPALNTFTEHDNLALMHSATCSCRWHILPTQPNTHQSLGKWWNKRVCWARHGSILEPLYWKLIRQQGCN